jgi:hypothetical protein
MLNNVVPLHHSCLEPENEVRYVLHDPQAELEQFLMHDCADVHVIDIQQGYINEDTRVRRFIHRETGTVEHVFAFKKKLDGEPMEINLPISEFDYHRLMRTATISVNKTRCQYVDGDVTWDVDFMKRPDGTTYFVRAEAEMPVGWAKPDREPDFITEHLLHYAGRSKGFGNRKLADEGYAARLLKECLKRARTAETLPGCNADNYRNETVRRYA